MIPGMNPKQMQKMIKQMGIKQDTVDATRVEIFLDNGNKLVFDTPSVAKVNMMGNTMYQLEGDAREESVDTTPELSADDVQTVMDQTGCTEEQALAALEDTNGDLAEAILNLSGHLPIPASHHNGFICLPPCMAAATTVASRLLYANACILRIPTSCPEN